MVIWLAVVARRSLGTFLGSLIGSCIALGPLFEGSAPEDSSLNIEALRVRQATATSAPAFEGVDRCTSSPSLST